MLLSLNIRNLAIIDSLTLDFSKGFTALTGETGAGKSIIVGALNLVLGERASSEDVRTGCDGAEVEALFDIRGQGRIIGLLSEWKLLDPKESAAELVLRRDISAQGRGRCLANGRLITLSQMKRIGDLLVDLHGQHQHQSLLNVELHLEILDAFGGGEVAGALDEYTVLFERHESVTARLRSLLRDEREIERRKDLLEYQLREIDEASLKPDEDDLLEEERRRMQHADVLSKNAAEVIDRLFEGEREPVTAADQAARSEKLLDEAAALDPSLEELAERMRAARTEIEDITATLRSYAAHLDHDPRRLEEVEERLHLLRKLKKKYGATLEELLAERDRFESELHALIHGREEREKLEAERAEIEDRMARAAEKLSQKRKAAGEKFSRGLGRLLQELEMPKVRFRVRLDQEEDEKGIPFPDGRRYKIHGAGVDHAEFLISPNPGEELKSLRRIASGGELSRIMLALKVLMRTQDQVPTLIFDEIDTGISGRTGTGIGQKMAELGERHQILCITHLPQIAARALDHFAVRKIRQKGRTLTRVERLAEEGRLKEIARLLGGESDSPIARRHAEELLAGH